MTAIVLCSTSKSSKEIWLFASDFVVSNFFVFGTCCLYKAFEDISINIKHIKLIKDGINNATHFLIGIWFLEGKIFSAFI